MNYTPSRTSKASIGIEEIRREIEHFRMRHDIDLRCLRTGEITAFIDGITKHMIVEFTAKIASKKYEVVTVTYPSDWWQAFKERWFPMWARKKWPVKYTEEKMQANAYHPDLAIPDHQTFVSILHQTRMNCYK